MLAQTILGVYSSHYRMTDNGGARWCLFRREPADIYIYRDIVRPDQTKMSMTECQAKNVLYKMLVTGFTSLKYGFITSSHNLVYHKFK